MLRNRNSSLVLVVLIQYRKKFLYRFLSKRICGYLTDNDSFTLREYTFSIFLLCDLDLDPMTLQVQVQVFTDTPAA